MSDKNDFVIKDRRIFSEDQQDLTAAKEDNSPPKETAEAEIGPREDAAPETDKGEQTHLPEINFSTFILSLNASALVHLGIIDDPMTGKNVKNLPLGKQTIDILGMLEEKTKGNLSSDEESMLKSILYDLRINYVRQSG